MADCGGRHGRVGASWGAALGRVGDGATLESAGRQWASSQRWCLCRVHAEGMAPTADALITALATSDTSSITSNEEEA